MRKYLISDKGKFYKANLHTHTTVSDGVQSPEDVKAEYMAAGYSVVAFTDHEILISHEELTDENFVAITSFEKAIDLPLKAGEPWLYLKTAHMSFFAKDPKNVDCPVLNVRETWGNAKNYVTEEMKKFAYKSEYSVNGFNDIVKKATEAGYLVTLNHPVWSMLASEDYMGVKGLWGVEVYNTSAALEGMPDTVQPFEYLLRSGERVMPIAADDSHVKNDYFGGFVMIKSEKLEYGAIMQALEKGEFYASNGPEIKELYMDGNKLVIECSPARTIRLNSDSRQTCCVHAGTAKHLTRAEFDLTDYFAAVKDYDVKKYIRVTVTDFDGSEAYSRAYFLDELNK